MSVGLKLAMLKIRSTYVKFLIVIACTEQSFKYHLVGLTVISPKLAIHQQKHEFNKTKEAYKTLKIGSDWIRFSMSSASKFVYLVKFGSSFSILVCLTVFLVGQHYSILVRFHFFAHENINKVADLNSIADRPKTLPNLKSCFIRIVTF